ncbi:heterokaryon incompatibility -domain-containing protein [Rutstroemia sp. NJR-2017a BBW]|nr:heterokaryon incompatibility -domain-containing protein [Rutstroemia sp. NJR-2017a BBW]
MGRYLALSHRWIQGPTPEWVTREANNSFKTRFEWFSIDELPATVNDAVKVTRELGFQYVWIDSICIIQDSPQDWATEASKMADVYTNAFLTLFADCGKDDNSIFEEDVESAYLSDRAWIFQERILSVRILHFGRDQIF